MSYPNAAKGMRYVFISEIIELIGSILVTLLLSLIKNTTAVTALTVSGFVLDAASTALCLTGLYYARQDDSNFSDAFFISLGVLIANLIIGVMQLFNLIPTSTNTFGDALLTISNMMIILGIRRIYLEQGDTVQADKARKSLTFFAVYFATVLATSFIALIAASSTFGAVAAMVILVIALVFALISYFLYLTLLNSAAKDFR